MQFATKLIATIFVLALSVPAAYAGHHESGKDAKPAGEKTAKDCPYTEAEAACGTGKCATCAKCDAGDCNGEKCAEKDCADCAEAKAECAKCAAAADDETNAGCCKEGAECEAAKEAEGDCPHCGKKN